VILLLTAGLAAFAVALLPAPTPWRAVPRSAGGSAANHPSDGPSEAGSRSSAPGDAVVRRHRLPLGLAAGSGGFAMTGPPVGVAVFLLVFIAVWVVAGRVEPAAVRREREALRRDLPHVVGLLGVVLAAGASVPRALVEVSGAVPGPAADRLRLTANRLALGVPPDQVWAEVAASPGLAPLGRPLERAARSGSAVAEVVDRLGDDLAREARLEVEDRARTVGVRAALPLGLCLLPAFLLVGIVPVVAAALSAVGW
jgi:Flp pilus assembly protein TadB